MLHYFAGSGGPGGVVPEVTFWDSCLQIIAGRTEKAKAHGVSPWTSSLI